MVAKLCPDVLDKLDIFILEIEELEIPKVPFKCHILKVMYCYDSTIHYGCSTLVLIKQSSYICLLCILRTL